ncbi:inositol monophosphatase family protein, partial [Micrococcus sp. HSID17227]
MSPALPRPAELRAIALDAARAVVGDLAAAFRSPTAIGPEAKTTHHDLVTVHDRHTEARLVAALTTAVPGSGVLGEELGAQAGTGEAARLTWIVDPIDGTSNFTHGFAMFSVSLAAEVDGEVVAGVVLDPVGRLAFSADADGAYLTRGDGPERPLAEVG